VAAPHPDDETLGCGGTLLRHRLEGDRLHWVVFTEMREDYGFSSEQVRSRRAEVEAAAAHFGFATVRSLGLEPARLDTQPIAQIIAQFSKIVSEVGPEVLYIPYRGDAHSDHAVVFDTAAACTKWFRFPTVRRILAYETLSETEAALRPDTARFQPNVFVDISAFIDEKVAALKLYVSEVGEFPFPRSEQGVRALAAVRGIASGFVAAEAFMLLKERL
jgi:LmbE family N-acetylglucosaminyl deacetylase